jgi:DNA-binding transcriptional regulator WhiA
LVKEVITPLQQLSANFKNSSEWRLKKYDIVVYFKIIEQIEEFMIRNL